MYIILALRKSALLVLFSSYIFLVDPCLGQGMVVVGGSADGDDSSSKEPTVPKKLSLKKIENHMKIATAHLEDHHFIMERDGEERVAVKDKPTSLQNPDKHASEEFILTFLLKQYPRSTSVEEQVEILQNLENFSHKFENGRDLFKATGALREILLPALNSSFAEVRRGAIGVFAIASQNNLEVQQIAADAGVIRILIHCISFDQVGSIRSKALWALSALVRNFRRGQIKFIQDGGIHALVRVASLSETRKRSLNFVTDLLDERDYCRENKDNDEEQDKEIETDDPCDDLQVLERSLKEAGWCDVVQDSVKNIPGFDTEDQLLTIKAVASSLLLCGDKVLPHRHIFQQLLSKLEQLGDEWATEVDDVRKVVKLLDHYKGNNSVTSSDTEVTRSSKSEL